MQWLVWKNNTKSVEEIIEKIILSQQTKLIVEDPEKEDEE